ncbi:MAG: glutaminyl-peptide cyclotransferase [Pseudomonadales bacterium]|nr:glutaminyl-peptide cyclotransferase [Halioglobus sp.]MCP5129711.1 glutaminyl-peptide cyclotransferase [Pseudomonadales bacterium]
MPRALPLLLLALLCVPAAAVEQYGYKVTGHKPQARDTYVQGLEIVDGILYVSSGGYGTSRLQSFDFANGKLLLERRLNPRLFAEGLTVVGERLYQLTWRARMLLVYNRSDLVGVEKWQIPGEGWGLTHDGEQLIYSDGSDQLYFISTTQRKITRRLKVTESGKPVVRLNELEWIDGRIWANIWQTNRIVIIDPATGEVEASVDLTGLLPVMERRPDTDVLNGIARNPADGSIWVTGKNWPWLYRIELVPKPATEPHTRTAESR